MWRQRVAVSLLFYLIVSSAAAESCVVATDGLASMHPETVRMKNDDGEEISLQVLVADDGFERASGFQHICPDVIEDTLILFRYPREVRGQFHMQNVHSPLDIAFMDGDGNVVSVLLMETYSGDHRPLYGPPGAFQYALEARPGFFQSFGISPQASNLLLN